jgi:hypothetical protein
MLLGRFTHRTNFSFGRKFAWPSPSPRDADGWAELMTPTLDRVPSGLSITVRYVPYSCFWAQEGGSWVIDKHRWAKRTRY